MTGVQALERKHPGLPVQPGKVERREFEYIRHGTLAFTFNFDVATGQVTAVTAQPTRTEQDFLAHIQGRISAEPTIRKWHYVCDNLNTHLSESLVRYNRHYTDLYRAFFSHRRGAKNAEKPLKTLRTLRLCGEFHRFVPVDLNRYKLYYTDLSGHFFLTAEAQRTPRNP
jgi:hypothetical protein